MASGGRLVVDGSSASSACGELPDGFLLREFSLASSAGVAAVAGMFGVEDVPSEVVGFLTGASVQAQAAWLSLVAHGASALDAALLCPQPLLPSQPWLLWGALCAAAARGEAGEVSSRVRTDDLSSLLLFLAGRDAVPAPVLAACWRLARFDVPSAVVLLLSGRDASCL